MRDQIRHLLLDAINPEEALLELETTFYENLREFSKQEPILLDRLSRYSTVEEYLSDSENESYDVSLMLENMQDDLDYLLMLRFDQVEDGVKKEMIKGDLTKGVLEDMRKSGILRLNKDPLTEDEVEEFYVDLFLELDDKRNEIFKEAMAMDPKVFYEKGEEGVAAYKAKHGLLMDAGDFVDQFRQFFDERTFTALAAKKVYESIRYHSRYELEELEEEDSDDERDFSDAGRPSLLDQDLEDIPVGPSEPEAILVPVGDLSKDDYDRVYDLLYEYNGKRVLPSDENGAEEAYWGTFADDFQDMLDDYFSEVLDKTLKFFLKDRTAEYDSFAKFLHLSEEDKKDPVSLLEASDDLSSRLSVLREGLWENLTEAPVAALYEMGEAINKR